MTQPVSLHEPQRPRNSVPRSVPNTERASPVSELSHGAPLPSGPEASTPFPSWTSPLVLSLLGPGPPSQAGASLHSPPPNLCPHSLTSHSHLHSESTYGPLPDISASPRTPSVCGLVPCVSISFCSGFSPLFTPLPGPLPLCLDHGGGQAGRAGLGSH